MSVHIPTVKLAIRRSRPREAVSALAVALIVCTVVSACTSSNATNDHPARTTGVGKPVSGGILRNGVTDPGTSLDPVTVATPGGTEIVDTVTETLVQISSKNTATPLLATKWEPSADGLTWKVTIRSRVKFNNGASLTPADVVATYNRLIAPNSTSAAKGSLTVLKSVRPDADGKAVDFLLTKPFSDFPFLLSGSNTSILPANYQLGTWQRNYVGTGPFTVLQYQAGQGVTFTKNPNYWNASHIHLDGIKTTFFKDQQSEVLALQSGEIDGLYGESVPTNLTSALDASKYNFVSSPGSGFEAFALRVDQAPFNDVKVRQAIAWALNRKALITTIYDGLAKIGNDNVFGPTHPIQPQGLPQREANPGKVKQLLGDRKVSFTITASSPDQQQALTIQQELNKYPNFSVKVDVQSPSEYYAPGANSPWLTAPATLTGWASRPSPSQFFAYLYRAGAAWNASHYANSQADALSDQYDATTDPAKRQQIVNQLAKIEYEDVPVIITAFQYSRYVLSKRLHMQLLPNEISYTDAYLSK